MTATAKWTSCETSGCSVPTRNKILEGRETCADTLSEKDDMQVEEKEDNLQTQKKKGMLLADLLSLGN